MSQNTIALATVRKRERSRILRPRLAAIASVFLIVVVVAAVLAPVLAPYHPNATDILDALAPASAGWPRNAGDQTSWEPPFRGAMARSATARTEAATK